MVLNFDFLFYVFILGFYPYPIADQKTFSMKVYNYDDGITYTVSYYFSDLLLTFMFIRLLYIIQWLAI